MRRVLAALAAVLAAATLVAVDARADDGPTTTDAVVTSSDGTEIAVTVFRPAGVSAAAPAPVVLHSHGWAGSRQRSAGSGTVAPFLAAGYGMVSIDQRGHGESGGEANVQDPDFEVRDIQAVIDFVAGLDWVALDAPGDPVLGAIGGSYGGGYQTMTALAEQAARPGGTRFDALAPEITWHDLPDSLAPSDVPRTAWLTALYAAGAGMLPQYVHEAFVEGMATGSLPAGIKDEFASHGPRHFTDQGVRLDIPVLFRQGTSDNLFNLNQALRNFDTMLTSGARARSALVAYNGGHALPNVLPYGQFEGTTATGDVDACSGPGGFQARTIEFFDRHLRGLDTAPPLQPAYRLTTAAGDRCVGLRSLPAPTVVPAADVITSTGAGVPQYVPLVTGPTTVAGVAHLTGTLTTVGLDTRVFLGLAVGTSPLDARVLQNNLLPLRRAESVTGESFRAELPGVVADVAPGQTLFLVVTPVSDQFGAHGSRTPGLVQITAAAVELPLVTDR